MGTSADVAGEISIDRAVYEGRLPSGKVASKNVIALRIVGDPM